MKDNITKDIKEALSALSTIPGFNDCDNVDAT